MSNLQHLPSSIEPIFLPPIRKHEMPESANGVRVRDLKACSASGVMARVGRRTVTVRVKHQVHEEERMEMVAAAVAVMVGKMKMMDKRKWKELISDDVEVVKARDESGEEWKPVIRNRIWWTIILQFDVGIALCRQNEERINVDASRISKVQEVWSIHHCRLEFRATLHNQCF
ncbi:uncharacterized protein G2W53_037091 [Senna tora]|uniref:Uncharacterized protein n=1 Tax=Senna tora TaxID=362788 RepID=A0A834W6Q6_9FABA|nr:uncharacterized protein G2W53_037091 [Senna tora]